MQIYLLRHNLQHSSNVEVFFVTKETIKVICLSLYICFDTIFNTQAMPRDAQHPDRALNQSKETNKSLCWSLLSQKRPPQETYELYWFFGHMSALNMSKETNTRRISATNATSLSASLRQQTNTYDMYLRQTHDVYLCISVYIRVSHLRLCVSRSTSCVCVSYQQKYTCLRFKRKHILCVSLLTYSIRLSFF